jgi:hypothetical protein
MHKKLICLALQPNSPCRLRRKLKPADSAADATNLQKESSNGSHTSEAGTDTSDTVGGTSVLGDGGAVAG